MTSFRHDSSPFAYLPPTPDPPISSDPPYILLLLEQKKQFTRSSFVGSDMEQRDQEF